jgi:hypothetical protein
MLAIQKELATEITENTEVEMAAYPAQGSIPILSVSSVISVAHFDFVVRLPWADFIGA